MSMTSDMEELVITHNIHTKKMCLMSIANGLYALKAELRENDYTTISQVNGLIDEYIEKAVKDCDLKEAQEDE